MVIKVKKEDRERLKSLRKARQIKAERYLKSLETVGTLKSEFYRKGCIVC